MTKGSTPVDPGFAPMALDLLASVLARADSPAGLSAFLADSIRELTGAACVVFTDEADLAPGEPLRVMAVDPARRSPWLESAPGGRVLELARAVGGALVVEAGDRTPLGEALGAEGFDLSLVVPLVAGSHRVGTCLVLGDPDGRHVGAVKALLDTLSKVVALVIRNAALFERQEQVIAARTRDLSEANAALRASRDRLRFALTGIHFVWDWDLERGVLTAEPEWATWRGVTWHVMRGSPREILGRIVHSDDLDLVLARLEAHVSGQAPIYESEHRANPLDGNDRWALVRGRATARGADGRALQITGVTTDVTERRLAQSQLLRSERLASLGTLAAGVAHEINNPLSFVQASVDFVARRLHEQGPVEPEVESALADASDGAARVRDVVQSLRTFSAPGGPPAPIDLAAELRAAVRLAENEVRHRARLEVSIGALPRVTAAAHQLGQVFVNLLVNASQAIPPGAESTAVVSLVARTGEGGRAEVEVKDTGIGIPASMLTRIFEPFFTTKPQGVGTGLGLSISHRIVGEAGGRIDVRSTVGQGSSFLVTLPPAAAEAPRAAPAGAAIAQPQEGAVSARRRLLIVDDEPAVARAARRLMESRFDVTVLHSGAEALAAFEGGACWDAVLCDLMMPGLSGIELYRRTRDLRPAQAGRFIFLTGGAFTPEARRFLEEGTLPWAEKPFDEKTLSRLVEETASRP